MTDPESGPICPMCHEARLGPTEPDWYVLYTADSAPRDRVQRGLPVGVRACPRCEHVALFLPPTLDAPRGGGEGPGGIGVREPRRPRPGSDVDTIEIESEEGRLAQDPAPPA
jgi:hypothetical protein